MKHRKGVRDDINILRTSLTLTAEIFWDSFNKKIKKGNFMKYIEGHLGYNSQNGRYGLLVSDLWVKDGFHCGDSLEIKIADRWMYTHMEMDAERKWYLVDTALRGTDLEFVKARIRLE